LKVLIYLIGLLRRLLKCNQGLGSSGGLSEQAPPRQQIGMFTGVWEL
jgi:hypothetical protein